MQEQYGNSHANGLTNRQVSRQNFINNAVLTNNAIRQVINDVLIGNFIIFNLKFTTRRSYRRTKPYVTNLVIIITIIITIVQKGAINGNRYNVSRASLIKRLTNTSINLLTRQRVQFTLCLDNSFTHVLQRVNSINTNGRRRKRRTSSRRGSSNRRIKGTPNRQ